jgi:hypothetical protein
MFLLTGRIFTINVISEKSIQIVLKKQSKGKQVLISVNVFGKWKYKADNLKLKKNDKISATLYINANLFKGKFYNDLYFEEIELYSEKIKSELNLKKEADIFYNGQLGISNKVIINEETGKPYF